MNELSARQTDTHKKISDAFHDLSPKQRVAARYVLDHPEQVAMYSMRDVAKKAGVLPPTMVRLAKRLGYEGFDDFRDSFRGDLTGQKLTFASRAHVISGKGKKKTVGIRAQEILDQEIGNMNDLVTNLNIENLVAAHKALKSARRVFAVGLRCMYPVAYYFYYCNSFFSSKMTLLHGVGGVLGDELRSAGSNDALVAISCNPYANDTIRIVRMAEERQVQVIAITDSALSPIIGPNAIPLIVGVTPSSIVPSIFPSLAMVQMLVGISASFDDNVVEKVELAEKQLRDFCVFSKE